MTMLKSSPLPALATVWLLLAGLLLTFPGTPAGAITYGSGKYGRCQYGACNISLTSSATLSVDVLPTSGSTTCTVASDTVTVTTSSSEGYTLQLSDADTSAQLTRNGGGAVNPVGGSLASPAMLSADSWGYRVDGVGGFGPGPTSSTSNGAVPSLPFAAVPVSSASADTITNNPTAATAGATTNVWYGVCVSTAIPSGSYSDSVVYTAIIN